MQLKLIVFSLLICSYLMTATQAVAQFGRPNIIYIMTDDMGYGDLGSYGQKSYSTPHLDTLAAQGMKFNQAYAAGPLCTPTRTGLMTGRYPAKTPVGLMEPLTGDSKDSAYGLTTEHPSVATLMQQGGYETVLIGKWHLGLLPEHSPTKNGFDYFWGFHSGAIDYISHHGDGRQPDLYENDVPIKAEGYMTDLLSQKTIAYLKKPHVKPFFLTLNFNAPHWPWQGPDDKAYHDTVDYRTGGSKAVYAAMMKSLDDGVGRIMKAIDEAGLSENTIIIFTNDNGGERYSDHGGLARSKATLWEGGIKVPAFVRWTGKIPAGQTTEQVAVTMDWTATILAAGGVKAHKDYPLDGIDLMPVCMGKAKEADRTLYWRTFQRRDQKAVRQGRWKYLKDKDGEYLFDLQKDPGEKKDLKTKEVSIFNLLKAQHAQWEKTVLAPIPL